jgi:hypothetical protein
LREVSGGEFLFFWQRNDTRRPPSVNPLKSDSLKSSNPLKSDSLKSSNPLKSDGLNSSNQTRSNQTA